MIAIAPRLTGRNCGTISFASTLHLAPILDLLLAEVPLEWQPELRLGLQEALVNAAKHGNRLDPSKKVLVQFSTIDHLHWWVIKDQGTGFIPPQPSPDRSIPCPYSLPCHHEECGRGLFILYQIFDQIRWNPQGTELYLDKSLNSRRRLPLLT